MNEFTYPRISLCSQNSIHVIDSRNTIGSKSEKVEVTHGLLEAISDDSEEDIEDQDDIPAPVLTMGARGRGYSLRRR